MKLPGKAFTKMRFEQTFEVTALVMQVSGGIFQAVQIFIIALNAEYAWLRNGRRLVWLETE